MLNDFELSSSMILNYLARPMIPLAPLVASLSFNFWAKTSGSFILLAFYELPFYGDGLTDFPKRTDENSL